MSWRLAHSLETFRSQVNERWPNRDKSSDGTIGDTSHAASTSDHNPNAAGVVCAFDLDCDLDGPDDGTIDAIAESVIESRDSRVAFLILKRRMCRSYDKPGIPAWTWAPYTGADPHTSHLHLSVGQGQEGARTGNYDDPSPWALTALEPTPTPAPTPVQEESMQYVYVGVRNDPAHPDDPNFAARHGQPPVKITKFAGAEYFLGLQGDHVVQTDVGKGGETTDDGTEKRNVLILGSPEARAFFGV